VSAPEPSTPETSAIAAVLARAGHKNPADDCVACRARSELSALRQELEEARAERDDARLLWRAKGLVLIARSGGGRWEFFGGPHSRQYLCDDRQGVPVLDAASRSALRRALGEERHADPS